MIFEPTDLPGAVIVTAEPVGDDRGSFARIACVREFAAHGLDGRFVQTSVSRNPRAGTLRGMHYQAGLRGESKLVRCTRGAIYDVAVDLRPDSPAFLRHVGRILRHGEETMLYIPAGCAHGFLTLEDDTEILYQITAFHVPESARGVRWNDPRFAIEWPRPVAVISARDASYPDFEP